MTSGTQPKSGVYMTIYIVDIEGIPTRYTIEWKIHVPELIKNYLKSSAEYDTEVHVISGPDELPKNTTPGMFLNFAATNIYKASQIEKIGQLFSDGKVKDQDYFLFTDAWHPGVINLKYMSELLGIKIRIGGLWHSGSYDPWDGLGRLIGDKPWVRHAEKSMWSCYDHNYFATQFHHNMFCETLFNFTPAAQTYDLKNIITGWPMEYMEKTFEPYAAVKKRNLILFPHRIAPEKQLNIFKDLSQTMQEYEWIACQEQNLTKPEYHKLLSESKMVFSANLQETLGISMMEGMLVGSWPMVPDRLSYSEMYPSIYKYDSAWTENWDSYRLNKEKIIGYIRHVMNSHSSESIKKDSKPIFRKYFSSVNLLRNLNKRVIHVDSTDATVLQFNNKE